MLTLKEVLAAETQRWHESPEFQTRWAMFEHAAKHAIDGLWLEFGVWKGKSLDFVARLVPGNVYGFDSFEGLPREWTDRPKGEFSTRGVTPADLPDNAKVVAGWFDKTLPGWLEKNPGPVAFVNMDADIYESTQYVLGTLGDAGRLVPGTMLLFDEYYHPHWPEYAENEMRAWLEFVRLRGVSWEYFGHGDLCRAGVRVL